MQPWFHGQPGPGTASSRSSQEGRWTRATRLFPRARQPRGAAAMLKPAVVIDSGSCFTRGGFAGQEQPQTVLRTVLLDPCGADSAGDGQSAAAPRCYPLRYGVVEDWDGMSTLWRHLLRCCLKVQPEEHPVLLAESPSCPAGDRQRAAEALFEGLGVPALHLASSGLLSLCAHGRVSGLALEAGAALCHSTAVCSGRTLRGSTRCLALAGEHLSRHLQRLLLRGPAELPALRALTGRALTHMKEQCCYVSLDYEGELLEEGCRQPARFRTPDGRWITLGKERFCCPEPLFRPELLQHSCPGLHQLARQSLHSAPEHARRHLLGNIVLSGGSSLFPGFPERMCLELNLLLRGAGAPVEVLANPRRGTAAWAGGSMAASLTSFQRSWMTKAEYQEHGAEYVHTRFQ
ncbi:actin-like protein 10 isoform X2 [Oenanthe melanoleuca]|uniref:actin-like protein 10 isoform X2 n=1 Tax=Oenanthe melanoleuca TaxID=2939378 RepID=UPI0024C14EA6|nr:actin-like protein 10 isoform X2 [Oenanthe melanoleuca]